MVANRCKACVTAVEAGTRLDHWLALKVPEFGRKRTKQLCDAGNVTVNGRVAIKSWVLQSGDEVSFPQPTPPAAVANATLALDIRFENEHTVIVDKPAGQATAPLDSNDRTTVVSALLARYPSLQGVGPHPLEPGLIHRLDNGTSGLLIAARSEPAFFALKHALTQGLIDKDYLAVVADNDLPESGRVEVPLRNSSHNARRVVVAAPGTRGARHANTLFQVIERMPPYAVVLVKAARAARHQIRVHLASLGCPLVNDELYGSPRQPLLAEGRHALHARRVAWVGNDTIPAFDVVAPVPDDLLGLLRKLGFCRALSL